MPERVAKGSFVELHRVLLEPGERAQQVPEETQRVPLEQTVKGVLLEDAEPGGAAEVTTAAGRRVKGTLRRVDPEYEHGFGAPVPELLAVGEELRARLRGLKERA